MEVVLLGHVVFRSLVFALKYLTLCTLEAWGVVDNNTSNVNKSFNILPYTDPACHPLAHSQHCLQPSGGSNRVLQPLLSE